jgi:hypothetical protein
MSDDMNERDRNGQSDAEFRTIGEVASDLSVSVPEAVALIQQIGVGSATSATRFPSERADQIVYFVRRLQEFARQVDRVDAPPPTRPIDEVLDGPASALLGHDGVRGLGVGADLLGRPFIRVYTSVPPEEVRDLPGHIEGYALVPEHVGPIRG